MDTVERSPIFYARIAGFIYLFAMALAIVNQSILDGIIVLGDAAATARNISGSQGLFRLGIAADVTAFASDVVMGWAFYELLKPVDKSLALLAAFFRVADAAILAVMVVNELMLLPLFGGGDYLRVFSSNQLQALARLYLNARGFGLYVGFIFLGVGSSVFAYLLYKSRMVPRVFPAWGIFSSALLAGGSLTVILSPWFAKNASTVYMLPMFFYEVPLGLWFLFKGVKVTAVTRLPTAAA